MILSSSDLIYIQFFSSRLRNFRRSSSGFVPFGIRSKKEQTACHPAQAEILTIRDTLWQDAVLFCPVVDKLTRQTAADAARCRFLYVLFAAIVLRRRCGRMPGRSGSCSCSRRSRSSRCRRRRCRPVPPRLHRLSRAAEARRRTDSARFGYFGVEVISE